MFIAFFDRVVVKVNEKAVRKERKLRDKRVRRWEVTVVWEWNVV